MSIIVHILCILGLMLLGLFASALTVNNSHSHKYAVMGRLIFTAILIVVSILYGASL
jgi:hypothetical protein